MIILNKVKKRCFFKVDFIGIIVYEEDGKIEIEWNEVKKLIVIIFFQVGKKLDEI